MGLNLDRTRGYLTEFQFSKMFTEELGWSLPVSSEPVPVLADELQFSRTMIAQLSGVGIFEITTPDGQIPDRKICAAIHKNISAQHHENVLVFVDSRRSKSIWYWGKREEKKILPREHMYMYGQPGDLFLSKLKAMFFDLSDFDENGNVPVMEVTRRLQEALDVERVTKKFYTEFQEQHQKFLELIGGITNERDRKWYASVMLNRLMFIYFLQRKFFIDNGDDRYLQNKLLQMQEKGTDLYYEKFLTVLFFEGFAIPEKKRTDATNALLGKIKYLNGGLFLKHPIEVKYSKEKNSPITIPDEAFKNLFVLFEGYSWNLNDTPGGADNEINTDVLGYIFEKYINQKAFGAYYTCPEITQYLCQRTIHQLVLDRINHPEIPGVLPACHFEEIGELWKKLDAKLCEELLFKVLPSLHLLDPACGSAAFLVAAMKTLIHLYSAVIGQIQMNNYPRLTKWLEDIKTKHPSVNYYIKKTIITENLYGVDIMEEGVEIAKLRLFLALVAAARQGEVDDLEPLPNIDFNILVGNSLVGLMFVDDKAFATSSQRNLFQKSYAQVLAEKNRLIGMYRHSTSYTENLQQLRDDIDKQRHEAINTLNGILCDGFIEFKIKYEEAIWDEKTNKQGKTEKRPLVVADMEVLKPFHWGFEFDEIINIHGGFDAIITNPPWEIFKPNAKEFLADEKRSKIVTKNKMTIKDFEKEQATVLQDPEIRKAWLHYLSEYPHVSAFFRGAPQYKNQISIVNGKKAGTDINLYKLFTEQCFNLLKKGGYCGIVIPSGIYTDLGTKQLREMLFNQTSVTGLFCFENRKGIFENVDSRFKFVVLTYEKGRATKEFPAAFMRHEVKELESFPEKGAMDISVDLVQRLSPDSLSVMEFKNPMDIEICQRMLQFPLLGADIPDKWNLKLTNEFHMNLDSHLFKTEPGKGRLPLYEGKMIWQYEHCLSEPRYWIDEKVGRQALIGKKKDIIQKMNYEGYRIAHRSIASDTNKRTMIATVLPPFTFYGHSLNASINKFNGSTLLYIVSVLNSFVVDFAVRVRVNTNLTMFYIYQLPVPRLTESDDVFFPIVERAAKLICTSPEFDDLAKEIFGPEATAATIGLTDPVERAACRAQLDGIIAHLYGLTQEEFAYILTTFPIVKQEVKDAALAEYRALMPLVPDQELQHLIKNKESLNVEFKSTARYNLNTQRPDKTMELMILKTVAAFLNSDGGTLLIGVDDDGQILGLTSDYSTFGKRPDKDGYENWLTSLLLDHIGKIFSPYIRIRFYAFGGKEICRVDVKMAQQPAYVKEGTLETFYIRTNNSTRSLTPRETGTYCLEKWGK